MTVGIGRGGLSADLRIQRGQSPGQGWGARVECREVTREVWWPGFGVDLGFDSGVLGRRTPPIRGGTVCFLRFMLAAFQGIDWQWEARNLGIQKEESLDPAGSMWS